MEIINNEKMVSRNSRVGQYASILGLLILAAGLFMSFQGEQWVLPSFAALLVGFILSQVGLYYGNRYGRTRQDLLLNQALKGLDGRYKLYHNTKVANHLLVGPAGIWLILARFQRGSITYEKGRWKQRGGVFLGYMRLMAQEGIGRPDLEIPYEVEKVRKFLAQHMPADEVPPINPMLVFTNDKAVVDADNAPTPTIPLSKLKDFIRKTQKTQQLSAPKFTAVQEALENA